MELLKEIKGADVMGHSFNVICRSWNEFTRDGIFLEFFSASYSSPLNSLSDSHMLEDSSPPPSTP